MIGKHKGIFYGQRKKYLKQWQCLSKSYFLCFQQSSINTAVRFMNKPDIKLKIKENKIIV